METYVVVFEEAEHAQLPEDPLAGHQVLEHVGHLLQRHLAAVARVRDRPGGAGRHGLTVGSVGMLYRSKNHLGGRRVWIEILTYFVYEVYNTSTNVRKENEFTRQHRRHHSRWADPAPFPPGLAPRWPGCCRAAVPPPHHPCFLQETSGAEASPRGPWVPSGTAWRSGRWTGFQ